MDSFNEARLNSILFKLGNSANKETRRMTFQGENEWTVRDESFFPNRNERAEPDDGHVCKEI